MSSKQLSINDVRVQDAGFALAGLLSLAFLIPVQLVSMISFDATGLDTVTPSFIFMIVVPAVLLSSVLTLVARCLYTGRTTRFIAVVVFVSFTATTAYITQFYGVCGPNC